MTTKPGPHRFLWVLGILLVVGTAIGARYVFNGTEKPGDTNETDAAAPGVWAVALVEPAKGVSHLFPGQQARVVWVVEEGKQVKEGEVLVRLEERQAQAQLTRVEADLDVAKAQLERAKTKMKTHPVDVELQTKAIEIAAKNVVIAENDYEQVKKAVGTFKDTFDEKKALARWQQAKILVDVEKGKLKNLEAFEPKLDVDRAEASVKDKKAQVDLAKIALEETVLKAPSEGEVLRVDIKVGEFPNPKLPAIEFAAKGPRVVKAEVLQESADRVFIGQDVIIESDPRTGQRWKGKVTKIASSIRQKQRPVLEPFVMNDVRTLECVIEITSDPKGLLIGQRVRATFLPGKK